ncbi:MAG: hypothetical protein ACLFO1_05140 [Spirochaetaceae bacterium]
MSNADDVANILYAYAERSGNPRADFQRLSGFTRRYVEHHLESNPGLQDLDENLENLLAARLIELEKESRCDVEYRDGRILGVYYPEYFVRKLKREYARVKERTILPFPSDDSMEVPVPSGLVRPIDVTSSFIEVLRSPPESPLLILRLLFPDGIRSLLIPAQLVGRAFALLLLQKIRNYLRTSQNASYVQSRLKSFFPNRGIAVKEVIDKAMTSPEDALETITSPTDFSFHLWTSFSTVIIKEFGQKTEPLSDDHDYAQAAYLLGYFAVHYNSIRQQAKDLDAALKAVENGFHRDPYAYTISDVYEITDSRGVPVSKRCSKAQINAFLASRLAPNKDTGISDVVRVKAPNDTEYYVARSRITSLVLGRRKERAQELHAFYLNSWADLMRSERSVASMNDDEIFERDVEEQLRRRDPLLMGLLNYNIISTAIQGKEVSETAKHQMTSLVDTRSGTTRPYVEILELNRRQIYNDARLTLPVWQAVPLLYAIVKLLRFLFAGRGKGKDNAGRRAGRGAVTPVPRTTAEAFSAAGTAQMRIAGEAGSGDRFQGGGSGGAGAGDGAGAKSSQNEAVAGRAGRIQYQKAVRKLQQEYTGPNRSVDETLQRLADQWNPLIDPQAKQNLVEDVNALVRDFLRRMKTGLRSHPPDRARIHTLAANLCEKDALNEIRRREPLQRYVELYMLKLLGK